MIKWEYKIIVTSRDVAWDSSDIGPEETQDELNALGQEGWELVQVINQIISNEGELGIEGTIFYLKRSN